MSQFDYLRGVVFDWAGTTVDYGSRAPAMVFQEIFRQRGIQITEAQAREPMGMAKREHIATIAAMSDVASAWQAHHGAPVRNEDIDAMYEDFLPLQKRTLQQHCELIEGVVETVHLCRQSGLKIGSSTGYTRELMEVVTRAARDQGYEPDCVLCAEDAVQGRPAPYLLYEAARRLEIYPLWRIVKVDDTPLGIQAGRSAGCWTIGVTKTGNGVGRSPDELAALPPETVQELCDHAARRLKEAGADYIVPSVAEIPDILADIEQRLTEGERPQVE